MGGADNAIKRARDDFRQGNYRWVASVMNHVVYADPTNKEARELAADALEQLGYQAEAGTWRNAYLYGAQELRNGVSKIPFPPRAVTPDTLKALSIEMGFDYMGVRLNAAKAEGKAIVINWNFTDSQQQYVLNLENSALTYTSGRLAKQFDASLSLSRAALDAITLRQMTFAEAIQADRKSVV